MKKLIVVCLLLSACESKVSNVSTSKESKTYEIICKHPFGHIEKYKINQDHFLMPSNFRGGLWYFTTIEGHLIRSTNCHADSRSLQLEH